MVNPFNLILIDAYYSFALFVEANYRVFWCSNRTFCWLEYLILHKTIILITAAIIVLFFKRNIQKLILSWPLWELTKDAFLPMREYHIMHPCKMPQSLRSNMGTHIISSQELSDNKCLLENDMTMTVIEEIKTMVVLIWNPLDDCEKHIVYLMRPDFC